MNDLRVKILDQQCNELTHLEIDLLAPEPVGNVYSKLIREAFNYDNLQAIIHQAVLIK